MLLIVFIGYKNVIYSLTWSRKFQFMTEEILTVMQVVFYARQDLTTTTITQKRKEWRPLCGLLRILEIYRKDLMRIIFWSNIFSWPPIQNDIGIKSRFGSKYWINWSKFNNNQWDIQIIKLHFKTHKMISHFEFVKNSRNLWNTIFEM